MRMADDRISNYLTERIPRYTSYPTAPHVNAVVGPACYLDWLVALHDTDRLSLHLHIPFCQSLCWYCGCHTAGRRRPPASGAGDWRRPERGRLMRIGLDHYARRSDKLSDARVDGTLRRNFQGCTDDPADALIGFGASAIGRLPRG